MKRETDHGDMKPNLKLETEPITKVNRLILLVAKLLHKSLGTSVYLAISLFFCINGSAINSIGLDIRSLKCVATHWCCYYLIT